MTTFRTGTNNNAARQHRLERRTHSFDLKPIVQNLPQPLSHPRKRVPPAPQRFKANSSVGGNWRLAGHGEDLLKVTIEALELEREKHRLEINLAPGSDDWCVIGPDSVVRQVQNFANLFTSLRHHLPGGMENDLGTFCARLVLHPGFRLSSQDIVSGGSSFVKELAGQLLELARSHPVLAFEVFTLCSTSTRVAIRECLDGRKFVTISEIDSNVSRMQAATHRDRCAKLMASDAESAVRRGDSQLLKRFLSICTDYERAELVSTFTRVEDRIVLLCTADPELAQMVLAAAVSLGTCHTGYLAQPLQLQLSQLPQCSRDWDGKVPEQVDLGRKEQILVGLMSCGALVVPSSGGLNLNNVPMPWDLPVTEVIALMTMESSGTVFRLALQLFAGFAGEVKRSSPHDWATADALRAFSVLEAYVVQLEEMSDPIVLLAKEVCNKFRTALVRAWDALDSGTRVNWLSTAAPGLDGYELALWRGLQIAPDAACDKVLCDWLSMTLKDALDGNPAGMRRCGVLGAALAQGARPDERAANFIRDTLLSFILAQKPIQDLKLVLAMLAETDRKVFGILADANMRAPGDKFILHVGLREQTQIDSNLDLEAKIKVWMQKWFAAAYSTASPNPGAQPPSEFSLVDYQSAQMTVAMRPSDVAVWTAQLEKDVAQLVGADPTSKVAMRYMQQIATDLQNAQDDWRAPSSVTTLFNDYVHKRAEAGDWKTLTDCSQIFCGPGKQKNQNSQVFFATALGNSALALWHGGKAEQSAKAIASFMNIAAIPPLAIKAFALATYGIFESLDLKMWWKTHDSLFTDKGKRARARWVNEVQDWVGLNVIASPTLIKRRESLRNLLK